MVDSIILATARTVSARVVTGDLHFKDLPDAIML
jgi:predicted nuclease of predicted toxin-antitoxin system